MELEKGSLQSLEISFVGRTYWHAMLCNVILRARSRGSRLEIASPSEPSVNKRYLIFDCLVPASFRPG